METSSISSQYNTTLNGTTNFIPDDLPCSKETNFVNWYICVSLIHNKEALYVDRYITPIWYVIGFVGNILTIKIWSYRRMKRVNNSALYLVVLALTDLMFLFLHVSVDLRYAWGIPTLDVPVWCPLFFVLFMFSQYMSPLLVFGFTMERFISITKPFNSERFSRYRRARLEIFLICAFAIAMSAPQAHGWKYGELEKECIGSGTEFFAIWSWVSDYLIFGGFPIATLVLNILVLRTASKASIIRQETLCRVENDSTRLHNHKRSTKLTPSTLTLVCISFYRIFTTLPVCVVFALQFVWRYGDPTIPIPNMSEDPQWQAYFRWNTIKKIIDEVGMSQYSCNIFIYLLTAKKFRYEFCRMFRAIHTCTKQTHKESVSRHQSTMLSSNGFDHMTPLRNIGGSGRTGANIPTAL